MTDAASINYEEAWLIAEQRTCDAMAQVDLLLTENGQLKAEVARMMALLADKDGR
jgi:hypothetical protein